MKIAVTGANGFVGRHVVAELAGRDGIEVVATSRAAAPSPLLPENIRYISLDIAATPADAYEQLGRPDIVMHMAWAGLPNYRSLHHFESELPIQHRFLRQLVDGGLPSLLVTGTCYEYGMAAGLLSEARQATPVNPYGFAKAALLEQLQYLKAQKPFALIWTRLFYMYGEGQAPTSLYSLLCAAVAKGDAIFPMSSGEQLRDFLPIGEIARILVDLAVRNGDYGIVNVCSGAAISVRGLVEKLLEQNGWTIALDRGRYPIPDYEPLAFWGDAEKLKRILAS